MIGNTTRDSRPRSWNTVLSATTRRRSRPIASLVLGFTSNRGKFELDTSSRIGRPGMNRLLVALIEREEVGVMLSQQACDVVG
jgi:hypothetical protein